MNTLFQAGARVQQRFEQHNWAFCFIGGIANFRWGTPRLTNDLDLTLLTGFGSEAAYAAALFAEFDSRIAGAMETLDGVATRVESVVGPFPHARS